MMLHNVSMTHREWLNQLPGEPSITAAAAASGIQKTTLIRQLDRGEISAENVISIARAFDQNSADALAETGYLEAREVSNAGVAMALAYATNAQLLAEINQRVDPEAVRTFHGEGDEITTSFDANLSLVADSSPDEDELRGRNDDDVP